MLSVRDMFAFAVLFLGFGFVSNSDYEDAKAQQSHYCQMVKNNTWPDYNGTFDSECR